MNTGLACHIETAIAKQCALLLFRYRRSLRTLTAPPSETVLCPQSLPQIEALAALSDGVVCSPAMRKMHIKTILMHPATALIRLMCACSALWQALSGSDSWRCQRCPTWWCPGPLCKMQWAFSKFQPPFSAQLSGRLISPWMLTWEVTGNVILHALDQNHHNIVTRIRDDAYFFAHY